MQNTIKPPSNLVIPIEIANIIIEKYDCYVNLMEEDDQIYGKAIDGLGTIEYKNGNKYNGEISNGMLHGKGTFFWSNGVKFTGQFQYNQITGSGKYEWPDGSWYEGEVKQGLREGKGVYATPGEDCVYDGDWKDGLRHGNGVMTFKSGAKYEGEFQRGMKHGKGRMAYPSGNYYDGEWKYDKKEGQGTMFWETAQEKYYGGWVDNRQEGWGTHIWIEPRGDGKFLRNRYEGSWKNGLRNGIGVFYYSNGAKYEGEWKDNLKQGFAIYTYEDGRIFRGYFNEDKMIVNETTDNTAKRVKQPEIVENKSPTKVSSQQAMKKSGGLRNTKGDLNMSRAQSVTSGTGSRSPTKKQGGPLTSTQNIETIAVVEEGESNPYDNLIDISDLLADEDEPYSEIKDVKNLLLRFHGELKLWYRLYNQKVSEDSEESFALTNKLLWKMLRDTKVLTPKASLAALNRIMLQGQKNMFSLHTEKDLLRRKLAFTKKEFIESLSEEQANEYKQYQHNDTEELTDKSIIDEELNFFTEQKIETHDEKRILLFRHFVEALVRLAYLKHGGAPGLDKKVKKLLEKIKVSLSIKKKNKVSVEDEHCLHRVKPAFDPYKSQIKELFNKFPNKKQHLNFDQNDFTMTVKQMIDLFKDAELIKNQEDTELVLYAAERMNDPEEAYKPELLKIDKSSSLTPSNEGEARNNKLINLLQGEVIFAEFYEILKLLMFKREDKMKEPAMQEKIEAAIAQLDLVHKVREEDKKAEENLAPRIQWPHSEKDHMFENLTKLKEEREKELAALRQKKFERENEEKECKLMEKEDLDINDEFLKRPKTGKSKSESSEDLDSLSQWSD